MNEPLRLQNSLPSFSANSAYVSAKSLLDDLSQARIFQARTRVGFTPQVIRPRIKRPLLYVDWCAWPCRHRARTSLIFSGNR